MGTHQKGEVLLMGAHNVSFRAEIRNHFLCLKKKAFSLALLFTVLLMYLLQHYMFIHATYFIDCCFSFCHSTVLGNVLFINRKVLIFFSHFSTKEDVVGTH